MDRVAELEREVTRLRKRVEMMQHVAEDMSEFVYGDIDMIALVLDDVLAVWDADAPGEPARTAWFLYANRIEYADADLGTLREDIAQRFTGPTGSVDHEKYLEACWHEHVEMLQLNATLQAS